MTASEDPGTESGNAYIGERIHLLMRRRGMFQTELAPHLSLTQSALSRKLRGIRAFGVLELVEVADLLGVDINELLPKKKAQPTNDQEKTEHRA